MIKEDISANNNLEVSEATIRSILREQLGMRFSKLKKLPNQANSLRNLHMRQKFGMKVIDLLFEGKRILNIDETWIGQTNFRRQAWRGPLNPESERINPVQPRITMIVALDNHGDLYITVMQNNTNQYTFGEYVKVNANE